MSAKVIKIFQLQAFFVIILLFYCKYFVCLTKKYYLRTTYQGYLL